MMEVIIVDKSDLSVASYYEGSIKKYGGAWGDPTKFVHLVVPEGIDTNDVIITDNGDDTYTVTEDTAARDARKLRDLRMERDAKLAQCDWTQLSDVALGASEVANWATYRQELRDITDTYQDLDSVVWPEEPAPEV